MRNPRMVSHGIFFVSVSDIRRMQTFGEKRRKQAVKSIIIKENRLH